MADKEFYFTRNTKLAVILPVLNFVAILLVLVFCVYIYNDTWGDQYVLSGLIGAFFHIFLGNYFGLFNKFLKPPAKRARIKLITCWGIAFLLTLLVTFVLKNTAEHSRVILTLWLVLTALALYLLDYLWHYLIKKLQIFSRREIKIAIAGMNNSAIELVKQIRNDEYGQGIVITGIYDDRSKYRLPEPPFVEPKLKGNFARMLQAAQHGEFDILFITISFKAEERVREILSGLSNTTVSVYIVPDSYVFELIQGELSSYGKIPLLQVYESPFFGINTFIKRAEDLVVSSIILLLTSPLLLLIALLVKLTSKGPVIFAQKRYGLNGEIVKVWKFRSMTVCEDGDKVQQAQEGDARITPLGRFLRKSSLDELPQFFNVMQGTMSVVGPRPHAVAHNEEYRTLIKGYMMRHKVKPGITGLAQVNGYRGETRDLQMMAKRVDYDVEYIRNWGLMLDIEIIIKTVFVVFSGKNAH